MKKLLFPVLALAALCSCSSEDNDFAGGSRGVFKSNEARLNVSLVTGGETSGLRQKASTTSFAYGSTAENAVNTVDFYFYDASGAYVTSTPNDLLSGYTWTVSSDDPAVNVEKKSSQLIPLRGLKGKNYPKYVVVILNKPASSSLENKSITQLKAELSALGTEGSNWGVTGFVMSNSTYNNADATSGYFATAIPEAAFIDDPVDDTKKADATNAVKIYVERLASKASLSIQNVSDFATGHSLGDMSVYDVNNSGKVEKMTKTLSVKFAGWGLNATQKESFLMKGVPTSWDGFAGLAFNDDKDNFSSSWAVTNNTNAAPADEFVFPANWREGYQPKMTAQGANTNVKLGYINYSQCALTTDNVAYCKENAPLAACLNAANTNFHAAATEMLVACTISYDGSDPKGLIRYNSELYTEAGYKQTILDKYKDFLPWTTDNGTERQLNANDLAFTNIGDAWVTLGLTTAAQALSWVTAQGGTTAFAGDVTKSFDVFMEGSAPVLYTIQCERWADGKGYYNVPIQHSNVGPFIPLKTSENFLTGSYGVIRNHAYTVSVNSIAGLSNPVNDASEVIIPHVDSHNTYFIGATINILSWRVVPQQTVNF